MSAISLLLVFFGPGYILYATLGLFEKNPNDRLCYRLLKGKLYYQHLIAASFLLAIGTFRVSEGNFRDVWAIAPFLFLVLLPLVNMLVKVAKGRNIMIYTRWDTIPDNYSLFYDGVLGILLISIPIIIPGYIMNKLNTGQFII
jgi:hypothetical protein